jgi:threonine/homoserine/homoserine lactone efflux protein
MISTAIGNMLPFAFGVAFSPIPIIAVILILVSAKGQSNSFSFIFGWIVGLSIISGMVIFFATGHDYSPGSKPSLIASLIKICFGLFLLFLSYKSWINRPKKGEKAQDPQWMKNLDQFTPLKSMGLGVLLGAFNPKNLGVTVTAALLLAGYHLPVTQTIISLSIFVLIATLGISLPVFVSWLGGRQTEKILNEWKEWLSSNSSTIMFMLFLFLGISAFGKGLEGLF